MHDARVMCVGERAHDRDHQRRDEARLERRGRLAAALDAIVEPRAQGLPRHVLEHHVRVLVVLADVVDHDDVLVVAARGDARLGEEPRVVMRAALVQELDRDEPSQPQIARQVDDPHATLADLANDLVLAEPVAGRERGGRGTRRLAGPARRSRRRQRRRQRRRRPLRAIARASLGDGLGQARQSAGGGVDVGAPARPAGPAAARLAWRVGVSGRGDVLAGLRWRHDHGVVRSRAPGLGRLGCSVDVQAVSPDARRNRRVDGHNRAHTARGC